MNDSDQTIPLPAAIPAALPQDIAECHAMIQALLLDKAKDRQYIQWLVRKLFGKKSEKFDPAKYEFFGQPFAETAEEAKAEEAPEAEAETEAPEAQAPKKGHGRRPIPQDLPRTRVEHDVEEGEKVCPDCGAAKVRIGEDVSEVMDYVPASFHVIEHVRPKYACKACQGHVVQAPAPERPFDKGLPGAGLVAHVAVCKYCDHLPLYRLESVFARHGVDLSRKTLCGWMLALAVLLDPLARAMRQAVLQSAVINTDDTPVPVQQKGKTHRGYLWVYLGDADHPYTLYDFTWTRGREGPLAFLEGYEGYLQADAFSGYDELYVKKPIVEIGCWAHARRYFFEARESDPVRAHTAMARIGELYKIEARARELSADERRALRRQETVPRLEALRQWLGENDPQVLPKSPIAKAIGYATNHWEALTRFPSDGNLAIDNNAAERALRPVCVGRKNWLFAGSLRGGKAAATIYSVTQSARRNGLDPFVYLRDVIELLPSSDHRKIAAFFPDNWKAMRTATGLAAGQSVTEIASSSEPQAASPEAPASPDT
ncbi:MAG: IS66 family transposase, partial [Chloroflexales bacterium]